MDTNDLRTKINEIKEILIKLESLFDVKKYYAELNEISDIALDTKVALGEIGHNDIALRLDRLRETLEKEYLPFYRIYLLSTHANNIVDEMDENNYNEIIAIVQELVYHVDEVLGLYSNKDMDDKKKKIIMDSYEPIYQVLINESMIEKHSLLDYCNQDFIDEEVKFELGKIIRKEFNNLPKEEVVKIELAHIDKGLGYNFLNQETIKKIGRNSLSKKNDEYISRRKSATQAFLSNNNNLTNQKKELDTEKKSSRSERRKLIARLVALRLKIISIFAICPISIASLCGYLGSLADRYYKGTTITYNKETKEPVGKEEIKYDYTDNVYQAIIKICSPWEKNPDGEGYIRTVEECTYKDEKNTTGFDIDEILNSITERNRYTETQPILYENDSTTDGTILVSETVYDYNDSRPVVFLIVFFAFLGGLAGLIPPAIYHDGGPYDKDLNEIYKILDQLNKIVKWKTIKESYVQIGEKTVKLQEEYDNVVDKYGNEDKISKELLDVAKKYIRKK